MVNLSHKNTAKEKKKKASCRQYCYKKLIKFLTIYIYIYGPDVNKEDECCYLSTVPAIIMSLSIIVVFPICQIMFFVIAN